MKTTTANHLAAELQDLVSALVAAGDDPAQLAAAIIRLRTMTTTAVTEHLADNAAAAPMLARLRELAPLRKDAEKIRAEAAAKVEAAQVDQEAAIAAERVILDERIALVCGLYRLEESIPITRIADAADLTRARVYRILADVRSHPVGCPCRGGSR